MIINPGRAVCETGLYVRLKLWIMDYSVQLLTTLILAVLVFLAVTALRRSRIITWSAAVPLPTPPTIEVTDPAVARTMLVDHADAFSYRPLPFPVDFDAIAGRRPSHSVNTAPHGPLWRALRCNLTAGILHPSRLALVAPVQRAAAEALVAGLSAAAGAAQADLVLRDVLYTAVLTAAMRACFGDGVVGERDVGAVRDAMVEFAGNVVEARDLAASRLARLQRWRRWRRFGGTFDRLTALVLPLIAARRRRRRSPLGDVDGGGGGDGSSMVALRPYVDSLLDLRVPDDGDTAATSRALTDHEMSSLVWEFVNAGTDTAVYCVEWTLAHLVAQPQVQEKLHQELAAASAAGDGVGVSGESLRDLPYLRAVIQESLRLHPPVPFLVRDVAAEDAAAAGGATTTAAPPPDGGATVRVMFNTGAVGRDRKSWTDPDEFRPERFLAGGEGEGVGLVPGPKEMRMMPFGAGRRYCPGVGLATMNVRCFLAALVRGFEWAPAVEGGGAVDFMELDGFFKVMKTPLRARITPRSQRARDSSTS